MNEEISTLNPKQCQDVVHRHSDSYNLFILALTIFSLIVMAGILIPSINSAVLLRVDFFICLVFLLDFLVNLWRAPGRAAYFFRQGGWLDLLGSIPVVSGAPWTPFLRLARLGRLNRLVRIVRHLQDKDRASVIEETRQTPAKTALLTIIITAFMLITIASLLILTFERGVPHATIKTGADAFWWAMVTVTTVGYGDHVPVTFWGRVLATILMVFGIGIFAVLTSFVATRIIDLREDNQNDNSLDQETIITIVREENASVRAELAELKELLKQNGAIDDMSQKES